MRHMRLKLIVLLLLLCAFCSSGWSAQIYFRGGELYFEKDSARHGQIIIRVNTRAGWVPVPSTDLLTIKINGQAHGVLSDSSRQINGALYDKYYSLALPDSLGGTDSILRVQVYGDEREDHMINMALGNSSGLNFYLEGEINLAGVKSLVTYQSPYFKNSIEKRGLINHPLTICDSIIATTNDSTVFTLEALKMDSGVEVPLFQMPDAYDQVHISHLLLDSTSGYVVWDSPQRVGYYGLHVSARFYRHGNYMGVCGRDMFLVIDMDTVSGILSSVNDDLKLTVNANELMFEAPWLTDIVIYNLAGEVVLHRSGITGNHLLNISSLSTGLYIIELKSGTQQVVRKFVKE